jgi:hypothetical protein
MATGDAAAFLLREARGHDARAAAVDLLERAAWARRSLDRWAAGGRVLELYDPADEGPWGAAIVRLAGPATYELLAWAVASDTADPAVLERLVRAIGDALRRAGGRRILAAVGDANPDRLALLQGAGFRFVSVERDAAAAGGGRPCDRSRDLLWMDQDL